jgi:hypothetical protein
VRHTEFMKAVDKVHDISYGSQKMVNTLFLYKQKDEIDHIELQNESTKQYQKDKLTFISNKKQVKFPNKVKK